MKKSDLPEKILNILSDVEMSSNNIIKMLGVTRNSFNFHIHKMRERREIYIHSYIPSTGHPIMVYAKGNFDDAKLIKQTRCESTKKYYQKLKLDKNRYNKMLLKDKIRRENKNESTDIKCECKSFSFDPITFFVPKKHKEEIC